MMDIVPNNEKMKQESIMSDITHIKAQIEKLALLKKQVKELEKGIKPQLNELALVMIDMDLDELPLDGVVLQSTKGSTSQKMISMTVMRKKFPQLLSDYPELVKEITTKPHIKMKLK